MTSEIRCFVCKGSKMCRWAHPSHNAPCGACFGTGCSTSPYDQPRRGTTVGLRLEDFQRVGIADRLVGSHTRAEMRAALRFKGPELVLDLQIHSDGEVVRDTGGKLKYVGILISWINQDYDLRLALDQQEIASQGAQSRSPRA